MRITAFLTAMILVALLLGCAGMYQGLQTQQEMECRKRPGADQDACARQSGMSYDEYQKQLRERDNKK